MTQTRFFNCPDWREFSGINHAFFSKNIPGSGHAYNRLGGARFGPSPADPTFVQKSRSCLAKYAPFPLGLLAVNEQVHSNRVTTIEHLNQAKHEPLADALVTRLKGVSLGILTADCVPVLFADNKNEVIGAAHAGWRGTLKGIIENTITEMIKLGAEVTSIHAAIGPCIHQENYEIGLEFFDEFIQASPCNARFFKKISGDKYLFNLPGLVSERLNQRPLKSVNNINLDTFSMTDNFFSYRRSTKSCQTLPGNLISIISLV